MNIMEGLLLVAGWKFITMYPPKIRTIVFWVMNGVSGIIALGFVLVLGIHMPWGYVALILGVVSFAFWLGEKYPRHYERLAQRREIISVWEDFILFLDVFIIWLGLGVVEALFLK